MRAAVCVADFDMSGDWNVGSAPPSLFTSFHVVQTGMSLSISVTPVPNSPGTGTIDPMTGAFTLQFPILYPPGACAAMFTGQLSPDGNTFTSTGGIATTSPDCHSIFCACSDSAPAELRGSRPPCGNDTVDAGEECDDANFGFPGSCCALDCTAQPAGGSCFGDGNLCTDDVCGSGGVCAHPALPDGTGCNNGQFCDGQETTCVAGVCTPGPEPCPLGCDEGTDQCVTTCPTFPQSCRTAEKSLLSFKIKSDATKNKLLWKWLKGTATSQTEFGDPTVGTEYALCIYAGSAALVATETVIPPGGAWKTLGTKGFKYDDAGGAVHSINRVLLKGSTENKSKVLIKGKGGALPFVLPPLTDPITVQLYNGSNGLCWSADYSLAQMQRNEVDQLKAKAP